MMAQCLGNFTVVIAGSRNITNIGLVTKILNSSALAKKATHACCGRAKGADSIGELWADSVGKTILPFPADWDTYGKTAGFIRNQQMIDIADALILIWDGVSPGSKDCLERAIKKCIPYSIYIVR